MSVFTVAEWPISSLGSPPEWARRLIDLAVHLGAPRTRSLLDVFSAFIGWDDP
jgi:hypothetical protein